MPEQIRVLAELCDFSTQKGLARQWLQWPCDFSGLTSNEIIRFTKAWVDELESHRSSYSGHGVVCSPGYPLLQHRCPVCTLSLPRLRVRGMVSLTSCYFSMMGSVKLIKCRKHPKEGPLDMPMTTTLLGLRWKHPPILGDTIPCLEYWIV